MTKKKDKYRDSPDEIILQKVRNASQMSLDDLKEFFPALHAEITGKRPGLGLSAREIQKMLEESGSRAVTDPSSASVVSSGTVSPDSKEVRELAIAIPDPLKGFNPGVVDFIRRAKTDEEAVEVIEYMKARGEITDEHANQLLDQLKEQGLRSFGSYKQDGYYFHYAREKQMEMRQKLLERQKKKIRKRQLDEKLMRTD